MFNRILLPIDGSALAECIMPHALALAKLADAEVVLLHVLEESDGGGGVDPMEWHLRKVAAQNYIDSICAKLQGMGVESSCLLLTGSPAERILEQVEKLNVDLVLVSSHGQSGRMDWALGTVAHKLLEGLGTSIMLVRARLEPGEAVDFAPVRYGTVLVPLDGSRRAECILPIAERLATEQDIELVFVHVVQRPGILGWGMLADEDRKLAEQLVCRTWSVAETYLEQIQKRQSGHATIALAQADNVAIELDRIAEQHKVDLVLVSAHGAAFNPLRTFGDTVNGVLTYCHRPVLLYQDRPVARTSEPKAAPVHRKLADANGFLPPTE